MSRGPFAPFLETQGFVVLDGGLASVLESAGHVLDSELWSARVLLDDPEAIRAVHMTYLEAGADCITTASYQASFEGFAAIGVGAAETERLLRSSTRLAVDARDEVWSASRPPERTLRPLVAASVGPYGAYLADGSEYDGRYGVGADRLRAFHLGRFEVLASSGADLLACETIPSAPEAEVLLRILDDTPGTWAWFTFSCRDGVHLADGSPFAEVARGCAAHERVAGIGVNCTAPEHVAELLEQTDGAFGTPLIAYPNSGESYVAETHAWTGETDVASWGAGVDRWLEAGARVVGGCCRVGPEKIRHVRWTATRRFSTGGHAAG